MSQIDITTLGKSCEFFNGKAHEKSIDENGKYIVVNSKFISQEGKVIKRTKEQMFPLFKDDIVMVMSDVPNGKALAKCFIIDKDDTYSLNQRICCIRSKEFDTKYLYYQLNRHEHFLAFNNGENQTNLRKDDILACPLIKPSMEEQRRMVTELDLAFSELSKALSNTERNYQNSKELYLGYLNGVFDNEMFAIKKLNEITEVKDGTHDSPRYIKDGIPFVTQKNIKPNGLFFDDTKFITQIDHDKFYKRSNVSYGDILISMIGANRGMAAIVEDRRVFSIKNVGLIKSSNNINMNYLLYYLKSPAAMKYVLDKSNGGAQEFVGLTALRSFPIPFPTIIEQNEIVKKLDLLSIEAFKLQKKYEEKIEKLDELKSGILKRAFENELIEAE